MVWNVDWSALAMTVLAASASGLVVELHIRGGGGYIRAALVHPVLFACAIVLGPWGSLLPAGAAGVCQTLSDKRSYSPLYRILHYLLGSTFATVAASIAFTFCGGSLTWVHGADSIVPVMCAAAVYSLAAAISFGVALHASGKVIETAASGTIVATGWCISLFAGYALATIYCAAPVYAIYATAAIMAWSALAMRAADRRDRRLHDGESAGHSLDSSSYIDPATGLASRRYLDLFLERECGRALRLKRPLSIAVVDIDGFRRLSQEAGQSAMSELGKHLAAGIREYDIAALHSEGRMMIVLPETSTETAIDIAERLRRSAASINVEGRPLWVSVGLASLPEHGSTAEELINAAHYALNRGRGESSDRVHIPESLAKAS